MSYRSTTQSFSPVRIEGRPERRGAFSGRRVVEAPPLPHFEAGFEEAADLYYRKAARKLTYRHFDSAGEAIRFACDNLSAQELMGAALQVGEHRFEGVELTAMVRQAAPAQAGEH
jgi:hypothetical protein